MKPNVPKNVIVGSVSLLSGMAFVALSAYAFADPVYRSVCTAENNRPLCTGTQAACKKIADEHTFQTTHVTQTFKLHD